MSDDLRGLCGASTGAIRFGDQPYHLGPCVLRHDHDGPVHQAADGAQWMGSVGDPTPSVLQGSPSAWSNTLRDRIAVSLDAHYAVGDAGNECSCNEWNPATTEWHTHQAAVALAVIEPALQRAEAACCADGDATFSQMHDSLTAETARLRERLTYAEQELERLGPMYVKAHNRATENKQRAEQAETDLKREKALRRLDTRSDAFLVRLHDAEAAAQRVRALAADMRTWCSPYGVAVDYATRIEEALNQPKETP